MKRQRLLLVFMSACLIFTAYQAIESMHKLLDPERALNTSRLHMAVPIIPQPASPAVNMSPERTASPEAKLVFASEETADMLNVIVNKQYPLPETYKPKDLVVPDIPFIFEGEHEKRYLRREAARAAEKLFAAANAEGLELFGVSGYRSYKTQQALFAFNINREGKEHASRYSAAAGTSEHQTGLALDVTSASANYQLDSSFADTLEGEWLAEHAHEYGFIIRYPLGKEEITGYAYEPWHIRYVGVELAAAVYRNGLTLEEWAGAAVSAEDPLVR